ncbi:MAG: hypothetical protein ABIA21_01505 [Candidatus Aenigmatarchaeota archaeon]
MNNILSFVLIVLITVGGISIVLVSGVPLIDSLKKNAEFSDAGNFMMGLDRIINDISSEGSGATRIITSPNGYYSVYASENSIEYSQDGGENVHRVVDGNLLEIDGNDVDCYEFDANSDGVTDLVMENSFLKVVFGRVNASYNNSESIISMTSKLTNVTMNLVDSSVIIDFDSLSTYGTGYSRILHVGTDLPMCTVHFHMNSTTVFDVYYTLFSGADFVDLKVRNIR